MSEISVLILLCFFRAVVVAFLLTHGKPYKEKYVVMALMINWLCISLLTAILVAMFAPVVLTIGMLFGLDGAGGDFLIPAYLIGIFVFIFVIELRNNYAFLDAKYSRYSIKKSTVISYMTSIFAIVICALALRTT